MDYYEESWEDSDPDFRSSTPVFTSDDEYFPVTLSSPNKSLHTSSRAIVSAGGSSSFARRDFAIDSLFLAASKVRSFGQRKQRRFENDFVFWNGGATPATLGLSWMTSNPTMMALCAQLDAIDLEEKIVQETIFDSLKKQNPTLFEAFIDGEDVYLIARQRQPLNRKLLLGDVNSKRSDHAKRETEEKVEVSYARIDRKARQHLARAVEFVQDVEAVLFGEDEISAQLEDSVRVERGSSNEEWVVYLTLESPFLRMLAHGVAQFYKIPSKSTGQGPKHSAKTIRFVVNRAQKPSRRLSSYLKEKRKTS